MSQYQEGRSYTLEDGREVTIDTITGSGYLLESGEHIPFNEFKTAGVGGFGGGGNYGLGELPDDQVPQTPAEVEAFLANAGGGGGMDEMPELPGLKFGPDGMPILPTGVEEFVARPGERLPEIPEAGGRFPSLHLPGPAATHPVVALVGRAKTQEGVLKFELPVQLLKPSLVETVSENFDAEESDVLYDWFVSQIPPETLREALRAAFRRHYGVQVYDQGGESSDR